MGQFQGSPAPSIEVPAVVSGGAHTSDASYDYYHFTATGDLTVTSAGKADVFLVGGGGGGGYRSGGGSGRCITFPQIYLTIGTWVAAVGGGGAISTNGTDTTLSKSTTIYTARGGKYASGWSIGGSGGSGGAYGVVTNNPGIAGGSHGSTPDISVSGTSGFGIDDGDRCHEFTDSSRTLYGGGGGGGGAGMNYPGNYAGGEGGEGGGGAGGRGGWADGTAAQKNGSNGINGTANTGGGGGGGGSAYTGGTHGDAAQGGSGIVVVRTAK